MDTSTTMSISANGRVSNDIYSGVRYGTFSSRGKNSTNNSCTRIILLVICNTRGTTIRHAVPSRLTRFRGGGGGFG